MKTILRNKQHYNQRSYDIQIIEVNGKKLKLTYEAYNAVERYNANILIEGEWKHFSSLQDLGEFEQSSNYNILNAEQREKRVDELFKKASKFIKLVL
jgi:hypothetical protein